ncbi:flagellar hook-length control protein FliK [Oceanobacillus halophilus]|uniref:Flagellar hook-length control protein FliK n=1 Tax=Oceanobacillus halophilus TaxID=930130 RepID=A0A495ABU9_9BACI|nr:flagellar hook-length control protein FliK [Oceanobacillus halophilus]RKQ37487.1 flagellar hook-length control protein FliK [Oceanobacillus halophilus]
MNGIGMALPLNQVETELSGMNSLKQEDILSNFKQILHGQLDEDKQSMATNVTQIVDRYVNNLKQQEELDALPEEMKSVLTGLTELGNESKPPNDLIHGQHLSSLQLNTNTVSDEVLSLGLFIKHSGDLSSGLGSFNKNIQAEGNVSMNLYKDIIAKFDALVTQMKTNKDIQKNAPKILELLQQWTNVAGKDNRQPNDLGRVLQTFQKGNREEHIVWKDLVQSFQKRNQLTIKQQYAMDAEVTNKDITNWIEKALNKHRMILSEKAPIDLHTGEPLSKLEQYSIYINKTQNAATTSQQLMEQFQSIVKSSKFLSLPNGNNQLSITLNPNNLGEMMVRLIQINGEMTVKITVTTQAAKEMLETNINQLRNMFSPQQVVIEKQETNSQHNQFYQKDHNGHQWKDDTNREDSSHSDQEQNQPSDEEFQAQFREILNEKV